MKEKPAIGPKCGVPRLVESYNKFFTESQSECLSSINFDGSDINGHNVNYCDVCSAILFESQYNNDIGEYDLNESDFELSEASMQGQSVHSNVAAINSSDKSYLSK